MSRTGEHTALFGGSFDPVHLGHLYLVHQILIHTGYRRIVVLPVAKNHFKPDAQPAEDSQRVEMLRLAFDSYYEIWPEDRECEFVIDTCEIERGGISYTYDTVVDVSKRYSFSGKPGFIMGDDLLEDLDKWYRFTDLKKLVRFVVISRQKHSLPPPGLDLVCIENREFEDSSSQIREALKSGEMTESIASLMPERVAEYVRTHNLYRNAE